jgi:MFS family permease
MKFTSTIKRTISREMLLFAVILFCVDFVRGAVAISFLPIYGQKTLGLSLDVIGIAITAHYLTDTALKMVIGYLLDRMSVRSIVHIGFLISLAGVFLLPYADVPWLFISAAALYGVGVSPIWIVCLTKVTEENRGTQMGFLYTIWFIGLGAGPIVCNVLLDYNSDYTYYLLVGMSVISWILSLFISNRTSSRIHTIPFREQLVILKDRLKLMKLLLPGMILQTTGASMLVPILPSFSEKYLGMSTTQYTLLLVCGGVFTVLGLIPMGRLSDRFGGKKWFLVCGFIAFSAALIILSLHPPLWQCLVLAALLGLSYAAVLPVWNALLAAYVPPTQQGLGWGILSTVEGIGVMIGPVLGGVVASYYGESTVIWMSAVLFGIIGLFYLWFPFRVFSGDENRS